ncbi:MAG: hypothetical protein JXR66_12705 [Bacteroidales bacterium]|nr:hypothetical protein [Bacteroidales bacterium]
MRFRVFFILTFVSFSFNEFAAAQQDSVKADSTSLYKNIESFSKRRKITKFMYRMVFEPVAAIKKKKSYKRLIQKPYNTFEGRIIRNIVIITLDPFGYSATDTAVAKQNFPVRAGNKIHINTQSIAIRNLLLFRKNEPFNSLLVKESERLIRAQNFVHEVYFYVGSPGGRSDSVDIFIRELDKWSIIPQGSVSAKKIRTDITENNFLGFGHEFRNAYSRNLVFGIDSFNTDYSIPNIRNTYINAKFHFGIDGYANYLGSMIIDRPFFSPLTKWAGGISFAIQNKNDSLKDLNSVFAPVNMKFITQDYWAGKAIPVFKSNKEDEPKTNLILSARYFRIRYSEKPSEKNDPLLIYSDEDFFLAGIGISARKYVQDKYIFKYGVIEDVPEGKVFGLTGGYQVRNNSARMYLGMRFSFGNYYNWGYLSPDFEFGTFFHSSHAEQGVFTAGINYFTGLFEIGRWKFREFLKPQVTIGINRFAYDSLTINDSYGLDGFVSPSLSGTHRLLFTLQTQSYAPWNLIGFHFGPYLICSLGMLGNAADGFKNSKVYSQLGLGVLIKNENLVFKSFQLSISFYPVIPGIGQNVFKMNSFKTTDFGFRDFEIERPSKIIFQ